MANPEHLEIIKQGVKQWNKWREENPDVDPDFHQATLRGADLALANLTGADLGGAELGSAKLSGANLSTADLGGACLSRAHLNGAHLIAADLSSADLNSANFMGAELYMSNLSEADASFANLLGSGLRGANLTGTNLKGARAGATDFADVDLSTAKGLESTEHHGPSTIGVDTIYKSRGKIPEKFLRGCGVPDDFIAYIGSMVGRPIEFYSCFISYSTKD